MTSQIPVKDVTPKKQGDGNQDLYAKREKIYARSFTGLFRNIRISSGAVLFILFFGTVWLNWGSRQAVWWDLPERKFYVFGATFWPQDFILLSSLLIICAYGLFFITVFAGRVWCGYACPQSVWTWVFLWCEKIAEGDRNQRIKLDKAPMSANKFLRRLLKHVLWLSVGFLTGLTFVGYFAQIRELIPDLIQGTASGWAYFWVGFFTVITYLNGGWLREQVCIYMCPYARFQSVMFDKDTLIVSYNPSRGEPRGSRKKNANYKEQGLGDCIDCNLCVQVCPTGIDIRNGLQIDCISCAACVDVCDEVMDKMGYPKGLVSYTTEHNLNGQRTHVVRPRLIGYATMLTLMICALAVAVYLRPLVGFDVSKDRVLYRENSRGEIQNVYSLKVMNKDQRTHNYALGVGGIEGLELVGKREVTLEEGEIRTIPVELSLDGDKLPATTNEIFFTIQSVDDPGIHKEAKSRFIGPSQD